MAQAERLALRMQKELKILLTDPPPGVSFPMLSTDSSDLPSSSSSSSSLTTITALLEGPEETVYAKGVFTIKIQIPESYPFQPPNVTFSTPIYHPNIDNGGRICLDILNLPPKGSWQPSLNVWTVLTSIGLLLREPNPDDGLMCEASREYKYNRQIFNQKARSMTEKYAKVGEIGNSSGGENTLIEPKPSTVEELGGKQDQGTSKNEEKPSGKAVKVSRKLSLETSDHDEEGDVPKTEKSSLLLSETSSSTSSSKTLPVPNTDMQGEQQVQDLIGKAEKDSLLEKPPGVSQKLSLKSINPSQRSESSDIGLKEKCESIQESESMKVGDQTEKQSEQVQGSKIENVGTETSSKKLKKKLSLEVPMSTQSSDSVDTKSLQPTGQIMPVLQSLPTKSSDVQMSEMGNPDELLHSEGLGAELGTRGGTMGHKEQRQISQKLSLGSSGLKRKSDFDNKENIPPFQNLPLGESKTPSGSSKSRPKPFGKRENEQLQRDPVGKTAKKKPEESSTNTEAVIVLDSEDSEEEAKANKRSRLSLVQKRSVGKKD